MKPNLNDLIASDWTLFLDRDGVINIEQKNDYVRIWEMFQFCENAKDSFPIFSNIFKRTFIVTNQRGVEKGIMDLATLISIHDKMKKHITEAGGRIDKIYFCTALADTDINRKPNPGMAYQAKTDFPEIDLSKSIMVGNSSSDMKFGRNCGMKTVFITNNDPKEVDEILVDGTFSSLFEFANFLTIRKKY